jgi:hypothetical protein
LDLDVKSIVDTEKVEVEVQWEDSDGRLVSEKLRFTGEEVESYENDAEVHIVEAQDGPIDRGVPTIVDPEVREKALSRLIENKRFSGGQKVHNYLLRGIPICEHCGTAYGGNASGEYHKYYACRKQRVTSDKRSRELTCPRIRADWLEELVWTDVRGFLEHPEKVLSRVRSQLEAEVVEDLDERHKSLTRRLAAK